MKKFNEQQIKFLKVINKMDLNKLVDTKPHLFDLTIIQKECGTTYTEWPTEKVVGWYKGNSLLGESWSVFLVSDWLNDWLHSGEYANDECDNDKKILNSLSEYYKRYRQK